MRIFLFNMVEGVRIAFDSMRANKARAFLTVMGVAVGVFVVVAMSAAVHGINNSVARDLESAGPRSFYVYRIPISLGNVCDGTDETCTWRRNPPLTLDENTSIDELPSVAGSTAHIANQYDAHYKDRNARDVAMDAYTANWLKVDGGDIYPGRSFTQQEDDNAAPVALVNEKLARLLFGDSDPLGKTFVLDNTPLTVIGVYHYQASFLGKPGTAATGDAPQVVVPMQVAKRRLNVGMRWLDLTVRPRDGFSRDEVIDDVTALIRGKRGLHPGQDNTFSIATPDRLLQIYNGFFGVFFIIMIALSAIGLLVGGVGVVAIMMISVTERTREIGVRKALGATKWTILWQFLVEAATMTSVGASIGLALGVGVAALVSHTTPIPASAPNGAIVAALVGSAVTGIVFGLAPALRAARLDPVIALRYE